jgi:hypothetical protein
MRSLMAVIFLGTCVLSPAASIAQAPSSDLPALLVIVRHAEFAEGGPPGNPPLSPAGIKRAQDLAAVLKDTNSLPLLLRN